MSLWYDVKKKDYAYDAKSSWMRSYVDKIIAAFRSEQNKKLEDHYSGSVGIHHASDIVFNDGESVQTAIENVRAESTIADSSISDRITQEERARASANSSLLNLINTETDNRAIALDLKVDKEDGKCLSTNDYTTAEKDKLASIEENANKNYEIIRVDASSLNELLYSNVLEEYTGSKFEERPLNYNIIGNEISAVLTVVPIDDGYFGNVLQILQYADRYLETLGNPILEFDCNYQVYTRQRYTNIYDGEMWTNWEKAKGVGRNPINYDSIINHNEIFNDYKNNTASGMYSHIQGADNIESSLQGYIPVSMSGNTITLTSVDGLEVGEWISKYIKTDKKNMWQSRQIKSIDISNKTITVSGAYDTEIEKPLNMNSSLTDGILIYKDGSIGEIPVQLTEEDYVAASFIGGSNNIGGVSAFTIGNSNKGTGLASFTAGDRNTTTGTLAFNEGSKNVVAGRCGHGEGSGNQILATSAHGEGESNIITAAATAGHVQGYKNEVRALYGDAGGDNNVIETTATSATVRGRGNHAYAFASFVTGLFAKKDTTKRYLFQIGNGTSDTSRSNAFTVSDKGDVWTAGDLTIDGGEITVKKSDGQYIELCSTIEALQSKITELEERIAALEA